MLGFHEMEGLTRSSLAFDYYTWHRAYFKGYLKPHYPMPAIPLAVTIDYEFTAIWHVGVGCMYYRDDYETVFAY